MAVTPASLTDWLRHHDHVATGPELRALGLSRSATHRLVANGRLARLEPSLFVDAAVRITPERRLRAYTRAAGRGAVASHRSAGKLWGFLPQHPVVPELSVPPPRHLHLTGVQARRMDVSDELVWRNGIPVTTATRTLLDLASLPEVSAPRLIGAIDQALLDGTTAVSKLIEISRGGPDRRVRGGPRLRSILEQLGYAGMPDASALERHLRRLLDRLCREHHLPAPIRELEVCGGRYRLDFAWPEIRLAIEADGYAWHASADQMGRDRWRRNALANAGWTVLVFTWMQIRRHPDEVAAQILAAYRRASAA